MQMNVVRLLLAAAGLLTAVAAAAKSSNLLLSVVADSAPAGGVSSGKQQFQVELQGGKTRFKDLSHIRTGMVKTEQQLRNSGKVRGFKMSLDMRLP